MTSPASSSAVADSRLDAFKLTDNLQIGKSTAHAKITREAGQAAVKESSFTIGSITVGPMTLSYSDKGFQAGDQSPPSSEPPAGFFDSLKPAGITVEFLPAAGTDTSIESAGLRISQVQQMGPATQRVSFTIGRVSARIDGEAAPAKDDLLDDTLPASTTSDSSDPSAVTAPAGEPAPPAAATEVTVDIGDAATSFVVPVAPSLPDLASLPPALEAAAGSPTGTAPAPPVGAAAPRTDVRLASPAASVGRGLRDDDVAGLYVAVGAAAALMALAGFLLPLLGGRRVAAPAASVLKLP